MGHPAGRAAAVGLELASRTHRAAQVDLAAVADSAQPPPPAEKAVSVVGGVEAAPPAGSAVRAVLAAAVAPGLRLAQAAQQSFAFTTEENP